MRPTVIAVLLASSLLSADLASAQAPSKLPAIVVDIRGARTSLGADPVTAADLGVPPTQLPAQTLALSIGAHAYPLRRDGFAIGLGAESILARATTSSTTDAAGLVVPQVDGRLEGVAAVVSLNFGGRDGWSYISGGAGPLRFTTATSAFGRADGPTEMTTNVGGGARWFTNPRLAAGFDVRGYLTRPAAATETAPGRARRAVIVIAIGITLR
jgi:hypothetical protein